MARSRPRRPMAPMARRRPDDSLTVTYRMTVGEAVRATVGLARRSLGIRLLGLFTIAITALAALSGDLISFVGIAIGVALVTGWAVAPFAWWQFRKRPDLVGGRHDTDRGRGRPAGRGRIHPRPNDMGDVSHGPRCRGVPAVRQPAAGDQPGRAEAGVHGRRSSARCTGCSIAIDCCRAGTRSRPETRRSGADGIAAPQAAAARREHLRVDHGAGARRLGAQAASVGSGSWSVANEPS